MAIQLNVPQTNRGILSTRVDNMTCRCDSFSCHCSHLKFQYEDPPRSRKDQISPSCKLRMILLALLNFVYSASCDDHCVLAVTLTAGVAFLLCILLSIVWGKRWVSAYLRIDVPLPGYCNSCMILNAGNVSIRRSMSMPRMLARTFQTSLMMRGNTL